MIRVDLVGQRFGKWLVEAKDPAPERRTRHNFWLVICDCGTESSVRTGDLLSGHSKGCKNCYRSPYPRQEPSLESQPLTEKARECLLDSEPWIGGRIGLLATRDADAVRAELKGHHFTGPRGRLTLKGVEQAVLLQRAAGINQ